MAYGEVNVEAPGSNPASDPYQLHDLRPSLSEHLSPFRANNVNSSICLIGSG